jgi:hypothetical protein
MTERPAERGDPVIQERGRAQYHTVASGSSVETLDGERIGVIAEVRGHAFKIKTPRFHRDFWLRADYVRSSDEGKSVVLNVPKSRLDDIKLVDPELQ